MAVTVWGFTFTALSLRGVSACQHSTPSICSLSCKLCKITCPSSLTIFLNISQSITKLAPFVIHFRRKEGKHRAGDVR